MSSAPEAQIRPAEAALESHLNKQQRCDSRRKPCERQPAHDACPAKLALSVLCCRLAAPIDGDLLLSRP